MFETYECPKCGGKVTVPSEIEEQTKQEVLEACRGNFKIDAMKLIMQKLNVGLRDSKMIIEHTASSPGNCGRCGQQLLESGITYCPACNSLNLNW